ncbi:MAG: hypothetical protein IPM35_14695 [Myxococcales bacterium]|nr:hypothetical protein [Myxococcales bacterium]
MRLRLLLRPSVGAALVAAASLASYACGGGGGATRGAETPAGAAAVPGSAAAGHACLDQLPLGDCVSYVLEREAVVELLEELEATRDQRSVPVAEEALASPDPLVTAAGLRVLGPFAGSSESAAERAAPLIMSPFVANADLAAEVLARSPKHVALAMQYRAGHPSSVEVHPWQRPAPVDLSKLGFDAAYAGTTPYPPGDSELSAAHATGDGLDVVLAHYQKKLAAAPAPLADVMKAVTQSDTQRMEQLSKQMQALQEEYSKTQDPKVLEKMQALGKSFGEVAQSPLTKAPFPPETTPASAFVVEREGGLPVRLVVVYREALLDRTVVIHAWSPPKYPAIPRVQAFQRRFGF